MPAPPPPLNCPPGLEYLTQIDQLLIHQQVELLEILTGFETCNKYEIKNSLGQRIYFAVEDSDCCSRNCCGSARPLVMKILDNMGREVMTLERPLRCDTCCCPTCLQEVKVEAPPGVTVGYVTQTWHPCLPKFKIKNEKKEDIFKMSGPCVVCNCCGDVDFEIKSVHTKTVVGRISKQWTGILREAFTDVDNFGIQFPLDLDVKMKAVMLGACFLIVSGGPVEGTMVLSLNCIVDYRSSFSKCPHCCQIYEISISDDDVKPKLRNTDKILRTELIWGYY
ncbi:phospholipid scramblase 1-like [Rhynchocyon petersi]